jgi:hypothetical protein
MEQNIMNYTTIGRGTDDAYLSPDGEMRGNYEDKTFSGKWEIRDDLICLEFPDQVDDGCWSMLRLPDAQLQLFTSEGKPSGYIEVAKK